MKKSIHSERQLCLQALLKTVRREARLTQVGLAAKLDTTHSRISDYERGGRRLDLVQLTEYCDAMGIGVTEFVRRFEEMI